MTARQPEGSGSRVGDMTAQISSNAFYGEYNGHRVKHLEVLLPRLRASSETLIWTAGDSSLDNKYWFGDTGPAVGAYADVLNPPTSVCDVTYWMNYLLERRRGGLLEGARTAAINTAVEATTLNERCCCLRSQDRFIQDNIGRDDVLIVSVGGNDVALCPTPCTIASVAGVLCLPMGLLEKGFSCWSAPVQDCCCGCGASLLSCAGTCPPCLGYFRHLFGTRVELYIKQLTAKTKPKKILVCMIYYPDESPTPSWAGGALGALRYNSDPARVQLLIRKAFEEATSKISVPGCEVIPIPLFNALDGKRSEDYVARVEPSAIGGKKMAEFLLDMIEQPHRGLHGSRLGSATATAPTSSFIGERK